VGKFLSEDEIIMRNKTINKENKHVKSINKIGKTLSSYFLSLHS